MTLRDLWTMAVTDTAPQVIFFLGLMWVVYKLGTLGISRYFDRIAPLGERQTCALEKLAGVAERVESRILNEQRLTSTALRALWDEWEAHRPVNYEPPFSERNGLRKKAEAQAEAYEKHLAAQEAREERQNGRDERRELREIAHEARDIKAAEGRPL